MSGLKKIISSIEDKATANAQAIVAEANRESDNIAATATAEANAKRLEIEERTKKEIEILHYRAESTAQLEKRKLILQAKQQIINECINDAKDELLSYSDQEYFNTILRMVKKHSLPRAGTILFSPRDKERLPNNFGTQINDTLADVKGASIVISGETRDIKGGFILQYGEIEENCSFEALIAASKESLQDAVNKVLFE